MKKELLVSLLALSSTPAAILANTDVAIDKETWSKAGLNVGDDGTIAVSAGADVELTKSLYPGTYKLNANVSNATITAVYGGKEYAVGKEFTVSGEKAADVTIKIVSVTGGSFSYSDVKFELVYDFTGTANSLSTKIASIITKGNSKLADDVLWSDTNGELKTKIAEYTAAIATINKGDYEETYVKYELWNDSYITTLTSNIEALDKSVDEAFDNYNAYKDAIKAAENAENAYDALSATDGAWTTANESAKEDCKKDYEAIKSYINDFKNSCELFYKEGNATDVDIEAFTEKINNDIKALKTSLGNWNAWAKIKTAYDTAQQTYNTTNDELTNSIGKNEVFSDWYQTARQEMYNAWKTIDDAVKVVEADKTKANDFNIQTNITDNVTKITEAKTKYIELYNKAENAKATVDGKIKDLEDALAKAIECDDVKTTFKTEIENVNGKITVLKNTVDADYKASNHPIKDNDYTEKLNGIAQAITVITLDADYQATIDNYNIYQYLLEQLGTGENGLQKALDNAKDVVAALKSTEDETYSAASKFSNTAKNLQTSITTLSGLSKTAYDGKGLDATAKNEYDEQIAYIKTSIENYKTQAAAALEKYDKLTVAVAQYTADIATLTTKAEDQTVVNTSTGKTYGDLISELNKQLKSITDAFTKANNKTDNAHYEALNRISTNDAITTNAKAYAAAYEADKQKSDIDTKIAAAKILYNDAAGIVATINEKIAADKTAWVKGMADGQLGTVKYDEIMQALADVETSVSEQDDKIKAVAASEDDINESNAIDAMALLAEIKTNVSNIYLDLTKVEYSANNRIEYIKAENIAKTKVTDSLNEVTNTLNTVNYTLMTTGGSVGKQAVGTKLAEVKKSVDSTESDIKTEYNKENLQNARISIIGADGKEGKGFDEIIADLQNRADSLVSAAIDCKENYEAYKSLESFYQAGAVTYGNITYRNKQIVNQCKLLIEQYTDGTNKTYYLGALSEYETGQQTYRTDYTAAYKNMEAVEKYASLKEYYQNILNALQELPYLAKADKLAYDGRTMDTDGQNSQITEYKELTTKWTEISNKFNSSDLAPATLQKYLNELADIKTEIEKLGKTVDEDFANGLTAQNDNATMTAFEALRSKLQLKEEFINGGSDYNEVIATDNDNRYQAFLTMVAYTDEAYTNAKDLIKKYQTIKNEELKKLVDINDIKTAQDKVYAYATLIADLKSEAKRTKEETTSPALWDAKEEYKAKANAYTEEINTAKQKLDDAVNDAVRDVLDGKLEVVSNLLDAANEAIVSYDQNAKKDAFKDVEDFYNELNADSYKNSPFLINNLDNDWTKFGEVETWIAADKEKAAQAYWKALYNGKFVGPDGNVKEDAIEYNGAKAANEKVLAEMNGYGIADKQTYIDAYTTEVEKTLGAAVTIAEEALANGNMFEKMEAADGVLGLVEQFWALLSETNTESPYIKAKTANKTYADNAAAYEKLTAAYSSYENMIAGVIEYNDSMNVTSSDVQKAISALHGLVEGWKNDLTEDNAASQLTVYNDENREKQFYIYIGALYAKINELEMKGIQVGINKIRTEKADADEKFINSDSEAAKAVAAYYKENCEGLQDEFDKLKKALEGKDEDKKGDKLLEFEKKVAAAHAGFTKLWKQELIAELTATVKAKIDDAQEEFDAAKADYDKTHKPVQTAYADEYTAWQTVFNQAKDLYNSCGDNIQTYSNKIVSLVDEAVEGIKAAREKVNNADKPYITHDKKYAELVAENAEVRAEIDRLQSVVDNMHCLKDEYKATYLDDLNSYYNLNNEQLEAAKTAAETGTEGMFTESSVLKYSIATIKSKAATKELSVKASEAKIYYYNLLYTATQKMVSANNSHIYDADGTIKENYSSLLKRGDSWGNYVSKFSYTSPTVYISFDINGDYWYEDKSLKKINFVNDTEGFDLIKTTAEDIIEKMTTLTESMKENTYVVGDVTDDKEVLTDDYTAIIKALLTGDLTGKALAAADIDGDGQVTIGDATQVAVKVTTGLFPNGASYIKANNATAATAETMNLSATNEGGVQRIAINLNSTKAYVGCQMDIVLPAGMTVVGESLGDRTSGHSLLSNDLDNTHRVVISNIETSAFNGGDAILYLDVQGGNLNGVKVENIIFSEANGRISRIGGDSTTGINGAEAESSLKQKVYSVGGQLLNKVKNGINIIRNANGKTQKMAK